MLYCRIVVLKYDWMTNVDYDHGVFVPLKIMFPDARIPCVQVSLVNNLDPETHINIGKALAALRKEKVLILGSGFSFHNLSAFFSRTMDGLIPRMKPFRIGLWIRVQMEIFQPLNEK